jgi:hypothetical protein
MLIAEELLLLGLDERTGRRSLGRDRLEPALGGALLAELALWERIGVTPHEAGWNKRGRITIISTLPTDDAELDRALATLVEQEGKKAKDLISEMSRYRLTKGLIPRLLSRLATARVVVEEHRTVLGFIPRTTYPTQDPGPEEEIRQRLQMALVDGTTPTERTAALAALLHAVGQLTKVVTTQDKKIVTERAKALTEGYWPAKAVKDAISDAQAAAAAV